MIGDKMTRKKRNKKIFYTISSIIIFIIAFCLLINKKNNDNLADIKETKFNITPLVNERIVLEDIDSIYKRYFVIWWK